MSLFREEEDRSIPIWLGENFSESAPAGMLKLTLMPFKLTMI